MPKRLLIVQDDGAIARRLCDNLVCDGFRVGRAATARGARRKLESFRPELILLDLMLSEGDGFELLESVVRGGNHPPVIVLSARGGNNSDQVRALNLGADDYVARPFAFDVLLARMRRDGLLRPSCERGPASRSGRSCQFFPALPSSGSSSRCSGRRNSAYGRCRRSPAPWPSRRPGRSCSRDRCRRCRARRDRGIRCRQLLQLAAEDQMQKLLVSVFVGHVVL